MGHSKRHSTCFGMMGMMRKAWRNLKYYGRVMEMMLIRTQVFAVPCPGATEPDALVQCGTRCGSARKGGSWSQLVCLLVEQTSFHEIGSSPQKCGDQLYLAESWQWSGKFKFTSLLRHSVDLLIVNLAVTRLSYTSCFSLVSLG